MASGPLAYFNIPDEMKALPCTEGPGFPDELRERIRRLKRERNAVVLAHFYQNDEIQEEADFIGDSLDLSRKAAATDADVIVFCGVRFMADVAKILNPGKTVLLPDLAAGCSLEDSCKAEDFAAFRALHPDAPALTYINSSAEVKALSDVIVTSSNAERIVRQMPADRPLIFGPDRFLGAYIARVTGRELVLWHGSCIVHERFSEQELLILKARHPEAQIIAHPECPEHLLAHAEKIGSTSALVAHVAARDGGSFIVLTEPGIFRAMRMAAPSAVLYDVPGLSGQDGCGSCNRCPYMQLNTLQKLASCLEHLTPSIQMDESLRARAEAPLRRMLEMSA